MSKICIDHMISQNDSLTETIKTTISDHYTVLAILPNTDENKETSDNQFVRNMKTIEKGWSVEFSISS